MNYKWADYLVYRDTLNEKAKKIYTFVDADEKSFNNLEKKCFSKEKVISMIENDKDHFMTIYKIQGDNSYHPGRYVEVVYRHPFKYLRTKSNKTKNDNLDHLDYSKQDK